MPKVPSVLAIAGFLALAGSYAQAAPVTGLLELGEKQRPQPRAAGPLPLLVESRAPSLPPLVVAPALA